MTTSQELFLGVVTPALSDLGVGERIDAILDSDERSDVDVVGRWSHLMPIVRAFYERLGVDAELDHSAQTVTLHAIEDEDEAPMNPETESEDPPDPGALAITEEAPAAPAAAPGPSPGRVDSESHERLHADGAAPELQQAARRLYDDVIWLFNINDGEGALISLERLLTIGQIDDEVSEFLDLNGDKLLGLYEGYIGPFDKVPMRGDTTPDAMPAGYLSQGSLESVFGLIDGERSIADLIDSSDRTPLETCASIEQLHRARLVQL